MESIALAALPRENGSDSDSDSDTRSVTTTSNDPGQQGSGQQPMSEQDTEIYLDLTKNQTTYRVYLDQVAEFHNSKAEISSHLFRLETVFLTCTSCEKLWRHWVDSRRSVRKRNGPRWDKF